MPSGAKKGQGSGKGKCIAFLRDHVNFDGPNCLIWPFSRNPGGRGMLGFNGQGYLAHRLMCEMVNGPAPTPQHETAHNCGNGHLGCVHPKHLRSENQRDRYVHKRIPPRPRRVMLTAEQVAEMRSLEGKKTIKELCLIFNTSHGNVLNILRRVSWKDGTPGKHGVASESYRRKMGLIP